MPCKPPVSFADSHDVGALHEPLRSIVHTLMIRAPHKALTLVSGTRTPYQQWILRHDRCPGRECDPGCKGKPTTALVGRSHHENTAPNHSAADLGGRDLGWVHTVADDYGIHFPVPGENWHVEPIPGRTPRVPIIPWGQTVTPPKAKPRKWIGFGPNATDRSVYDEGGVEHEVLGWQLRLTSASRRWGAPDLDPGKPDGGYGPKSQAATIAFKKRVIAMQKANKLPVWPNADAYVGQKTLDMMLFLNP